MSNDNTVAKETDIAEQAKTAAAEAIEFQKTFEKELSRLSDAETVKEETVSEKEILGKISELQSQITELFNSMQMFSDCIGSVKNDDEDDNTEARHDSIANIAEAFIERENTYRLFLHVYEKMLDNLYKKN